MIYSIDQFLSIYSDLKGKYQRREISHEAFVAQARSLQAQDPSGTFWVVNPYQDQFMRHTGTQWVVDNSILRWQKVKPEQPPTPQPRPDQPKPSAKTSQPQPPSPPAQAHPHRAPQSPKTTAVPKPPQSTPQYKIQDLAPQPTAKKPAGVLKAAPILALIPSFVCGGLWFLYTFIGLFKREGLSGVDFCTPAIIIIVPALFWLFGKQLDRLLAPLHPILGAIPKPLRYGIVLGVPILLGCGCSLLSQRGYFLLQLSTLISVLVAGILMRVPEVKK
jgi:hypothetical protein